MNLASFSRSSIFWKMLIEFRSIFQNEKKYLKKSFDDSNRGKIGERTREVDSMYLVEQMSARRRQGRAFSQVVN